MTDRTCSIDDCDDPVKTRGWCSKHYQRWHTHGDPLGKTAPKPSRLCSIPGCARKHVARGWCSHHYECWRSHGDPLTTGSPIVANLGRQCAAPGCGDPAQTKGYCPRHYQRWRRTGDPLGSRPDRQRQPCSIPVCGGLAVARTWCSHHYERWRTYGDPLGRRTLRNRGECAEPECDAGAKTKGLCEKHYMRLWRHGTTAERRPSMKSPPGQRWCGGCKAYKSIQEFSPSNNSCKRCSAGYTAAWRRRNPDQARSGNRRWRARKRGAPSESYTAIEIAERDGWRCGVCGKRIGKSFPPRHRRSLSIDHIVPLVAGGWDVRSNLQATHYGCNSQKGHRGQGQLRLIG